MVLAEDGVVRGLDDCRQPVLQGLHLAPLGEVSQEAGEHGRFAPGERDREFDRQLAAVLAHRSQLEAAVEHLRLARGEVAGQRATVPLAKVGRHDQLRQLLSDRLHGAVAEGALGGRIELNDLALAVHGHDAVERGVYDGCLARFALPDGLLGEQALHVIAQLSAQSAHQVE